MYIRALEHRGFCSAAHQIGSLLCLNTLVFLCAAAEGGVLVVKFYVPALTIKTINMFSLLLITALSHTHSHMHIPPKQGELN